MKLLIAAFFSRPEYRLVQGWHACLCWVLVGSLAGSVGDPSRLYGQDGEPAAAAKTESAEAKSEPPVNAEASAPQEPVAEVAATQEQPAAEKETEAKTVVESKASDPNQWLKSLKWREVGPTATGGRVVDIEVDPQDEHHIFVASAAGGLWETRNNGTTWNCLFENEGTISIGDIALDPKDPNTIWIGSGEANNQRSSLAGDGIYKSTDGGKTWTNMGLRDSHHIGRVIVDAADSQTVYVAVIGHLYTYNEERGLYKTTDGGQTWRKVLYVDDKTGVIDIVQHPSDPKILLAASYQRLRQAWDFDGNGPGSGIHRSEDGGETWQRIEAGLPSGDIGRIGIQFFAGDGNIAYATVANQNLKEGDNAATEPAAEGDATEDSSEDENEEAKTDEEGDEKAAATEDLKVATPFGFALTLEEGQWVVASVQGQAARQLEGLRKGDVLVSLAGIESWEAESLKSFLESVQEGDRISWVFQRKDRQQALSLNVPAKQPVAQVGGQVYRTEDAGKTWQLVNERPVGGEPPYYYGQIRVDPQDSNRLYILGVPVFVSADGGKTFASNGAPSVHVDHHALWINPKNPRHLMLGNDGGFHISYDQAKTWDYVFNIPLAQFYAITVDQQVPYHVYGGLQDNGSWGGPSEAAGGVTREAWYRVGGGDGFYVQVDPKDANLIYSESQFGVLGRQNRATGQRAFIRPPQTDAGNPDRVADRYNWNSPILMSQHDSRTIYFGGNKLFMSYNQGDEWLTISPDLTTNDPSKTTGNVPHCTITTIAESPLDRDFLVVGTDDGKVHVTSDRGKSWADVSSGFPLQPRRWWCSRVECDRTQRDTIYVTFTGYREDDFRPFVFKTTDAGKTWQSIVGNLPNECVNVIKQDPRAPGTLYVGTDQGAYVSLDGGQKWSNLGGLPRVSVQDLLVHPRDRDLVIGTHGRGIYILDEITPLQERSSWMDARKDDLKSHLYSVIDWYPAGYRVGVDSFAGDRKRVAESPASGIAIWYELLEGVDLKDAKLEVKNAAGQVVGNLKLADKPGLHQARYPETQGRGRGFGRRRGGGGRGPAAGEGVNPMAPGRYTVELTVGGKTETQSFTIHP